MFATAAKNFVEEVDHGGFLIPVAGLNDTINLLTVVVKRNVSWFWQRPKYRPSYFDLNDILTGDTPIAPAIKTVEFTKYSSTSGENIKGSVGANVLDQSKMNLECKDVSKLQSSFGILTKEAVDVQKLLHDTKDRILNMSHDLVHQTTNKRKKVFAIVMERILTTQPSSVIEEVQQGGQCGAGLSFRGPRTSKISLKENGSLDQDSNITLEIPVNTTIAYAVIELEIKLDGHFEVCVTPDISGSFEVDGPAESVKNNLRQELEDLRSHFQFLSSLPATIRYSLLQHLTEVMKNKEAIDSLLHVLEQMYHDEKPAIDKINDTETYKPNIQAIVGLLDQIEESKSSQKNRSTSGLQALHLITSAIDDMSHDCLNALRMCCSLTLLQPLERLVHCVSGSEEAHEDSTSVAALTEEHYEKIEQMFASSKVFLRRDGDKVETDIDAEAGHHPLVLCIATKGLALLAKEN